MAWRMHDNCCPQLAFFQVDISECQIMLFEVSLIFFYFSQRDHFQKRNSRWKGRVSSRSCVANQHNDLITRLLPVFCNLSCFASRFILKEPNLVNSESQKESCYLFINRSAFAEPASFDPFFGATEDTKERNRSNSRHLWIRFDAESADGSFV